MSFIVFKTVEPTSHEFYCEQFPDVTIRVENSSELEACVKLRRMLSYLVRTEGVEFDVQRLSVKARSA